MAIPEVEDPIALFREWFAEAQASEQIPEPTAMTLATVDENGAPDARIVLLKDVDARGFTFFTNLTSAKGRQLHQDHRAALVFHWMPLEKQVRVRGAVEPVTEAEADAYFATRPKQSQLGAWASKQSQPYEARFQLEKRLAKYTALYGLGSVPRPPFWSGFRIVPISVEFWLKQPFRLHDRVLYTREAGGWTRQRLFP